MLVWYGGDRFADGLYQINYQPHYDDNIQMQILCGNVLMEIYSEIVDNISTE